MFQQSLLQENSVNTNYTQRESQRTDEIVSKQEAKSLPFRDIQNNMIAYQLALRLNEDKKSQHSISTLGEDKDRAFSHFQHLVDSQNPSTSHTPTLNSLNASPR